MRVLIIGNDFNDFLENIEVQNVSKLIKFSFLNTTEAEFTGGVGDGFYESVYFLKDYLGKSGLQFLPYLFDSKTYQHFFQRSILGYQCSLKVRLKEALIFAGNYKRLKKLISGFDAINLHYCSHQNIQFVRYMEPRQCLLMSWYGSDMYECTSSEFSSQKWALKRADIIHLQTYNFRTSFLNKYGHEHFAKCKVNLISPISNLYFLDYLPVEKGFVSVLIGNGSGRPMRQIEMILSALEQVETSKNVEYILPVTSSCSDLLLNYLRSYSIPNAKFKLIDTYLNKTDLVELQKKCDIYISLPLYDTLSTTLREMLALNKICITGTWNLYGDLSSAGAKFIQIKNSKDLTETMNRVLLDFEFEVNSCRSNNDAMAIFEDQLIFLKKFNDMYLSFNVSR